MQTKNAKEIDKRDQRTLALWAADCAERVLPYFEDKHPNDNRPRNAIATVRAWARGEIPFSMKLIRTASLNSHAAARAAVDPAAIAAARAAGQAVATAHVAGHARAAAAYAIKALGSASANERIWQRRRLPRRLRAFALPTVASS
ncbi:MAG: hypothetical protein A3G34_01780 [Candidatus Lindowbacteria bacterium RIFCSPLOWO2_12_FULL_62_27]|nr:MAG: hypothetical protein A3I06_05725 [Candidatus Lindowbacteria bacterium RIFCSPLOWO2_02_FULL_62_12]OGH59311.1 MAG: hypothetical protein A3G34_01780 [Candidatus Lindowbacteria bacterium RIFCSPLOWO2_12_FULL_62_27]